MFRIREYGPLGKDLVESVCLVLATNGVEHKRSYGMQEYQVEYYDDSEELRTQLERVFKHYTGLEGKYV